MKISTQQRSDSKMPKTTSREPTGTVDRSITSHLDKPEATKLQTDFKAAREDEPSCSTEFRQLITTLL